MAVWSLVPLNKTGPTLRIDPEYYTPELLRYETAVKQYRSGWLALEDMTNLITDGDHLKRNYQEEGVLFLTSEDVGEFSISYESELRIDPKYEQTLARSRSEPGTILLTKTGRWYGKAAVCPNDCPIFNISADIAKIQLKPGYDPYFVACYLNSRIGYALVRRESTGATRDRIVLENLRRIPVPRIQDVSSVRKNIARLEKARQLALESMHAAEQLMVAALGVRDVSTSVSLSYSRRFAEMMAAGRLDSEYFSPRYQRVLEVLRRQRQTIRDVANLTERRIQPEVLAKQTTFQYIEIGSIRGDGIADSELVEVSEIPSRAQWIVEPGDVITSTVRPIRRLSALITPEQSGYVCSSGFAVLHPKEGANGIEPEVLLTFLRLPIICEILDLHTTASMYPAISTARLMEIPIAVPKQSVRDAIVSKVRAALKARTEAADLLEQAKAEVEHLVLGAGK